VLQLFFAVLNFLIFAFYKKRVFACLPFLKLLARLFEENNGDKLDKT